VSDAEHIPCPSSQTLASFIDHRLSREVLEVVERHVVVCSECYAVARSVSGFDEVDAPRSSARPIARWVVAALAVAAVAAVVFHGYRRSSSGLNPLGAALSSIDARTWEGRLSCGPAYRPYRPGPSSAGHDPSLLQAAAEVQKRAEENPTADALHAAGVSRLVLGSPEAATDALLAALRAKSGQSDPAAAIASCTDAALLGDLAVALDAHATRTDSAAHARLAAVAAERALRLEETHEALWNRALTLEHAFGRKAAHAAWLDYLAADRRSAWAAEARSHLDPQMISAPSGR
jgi:hypothetical protein